tara:strand:- start:1385 stop:2212 length:828 start_codon:yes stop_codon:yes gene_type:complete
MQSKLELKEIVSGVEGFANISDEDYFSQKEAISQSDIKNVLSSPADYYHMQHTNLDTPAINLGKRFHMLTLEKDRFYERYTGIPKCRKGSKEYKEYQEQHEGKELIKEDDFRTLIRMRMDLELHPEAYRYLHNIKSREQAFFWNAESAYGHKVWARGKYDFITEDGILCDLKTTSDCSPSSMYWNIKKWKMHIQPAYYIDGLRALGENITGFRFICIETKAPYKVCVYEIDEDFINAGRELYKEGLDKYMRMKPEDYKNGYCGGIVHIRYFKQYN